MDHLPPKLLLSVFCSIFSGNHRKDTCVPSMHFYITLNQFLYNMSVVMSALFSNKVFGEPGF
jgi:hypothetical protein